MDPIPLPHQTPPPADDNEATEVLPDAAAPGHATGKLPEEELIGLVTDVLAAPFYLLPADTRAHLRTAGREATLVLTSLSGTLLKGAAIALNVAAESLKEYSARHANVTDLDAARQKRQRVEIEIE